jgi:flagellar hook protein FlgE
MMRSLFAGVAGLQNHQVRMDVVGNNIANVNTTGFKKGRVNFQDLLYQQMSGAARPTDEVGGVNPKEIGLGMSIASIDTIHTQGSLQTTGVGTDLAIQGSGFFVLKNGEKSFYTRAGAFGLDNAGTLVNPANGLRVQGWMARAVEGAPRIDTPGTWRTWLSPSAPRILPGRRPRWTSPAIGQAHPEIPAGAGPQATLDGTWGTDFKVYDSFGEVHTLRVDFTRVPGQTNNWRATVIVDPESPTATNTAVGIGAAPAGGANNFTINFSNLGTLAGVTEEPATPARHGRLVGPGGLRRSRRRAAPGGGATRQEFQINLGRIGSVVNTVTQFAEKSSTKAFMQDGYPWAIWRTTRSTSRGHHRRLLQRHQPAHRQVAMASFPIRRPGEGGREHVRRLQQLGPRQRVALRRRGEGKADRRGPGNVQRRPGRAVHRHDRDQRGFQANSKTIQTSDQMLQELLTLKR